MLAVSNVALAANGELPHQEMPRNAVQAAVYRHIVAWMPRTRIVEPSGRRWLIRTAAEFKTVGKGLPWAVWTIQKALRALAADGWIEIRHGRHPFGDQEHQQHCSWITLLDREQRENPNVALPAIRVQQGAQRANIAATFGATFDPPLEQRSSITYKFSTRRQSEDASRFAAPRVTDASRQEAEEGSEVQKSEIGNLATALSATVGEFRLSTTEEVQLAAAKEEALPTAAEVFASLKGKRPPAADPSKPLTPTALHYEFGRAWLDTYPGEATVPNTARRLGQNKNLITYLREQKASDPEIIAMVHKATKEWPGFVAFIAARGGPKLAEVRPSLVAMLTHRDKLVNFYRAPNATTDIPPELVMIDGIKPVKKMWKPPSV